MAGTGTIGAGPIIPIWAPGTIYPPGSVVTPTSVSGGTTLSPPTNADFSSGSLTGWTADAGWVYDGTVGFNDTKSAKVPANTGTNLRIINNNQVAVTPGKSISASCLFHFGAVLPTTALICIFWYDSGHALLSTSTGTTSTGGAAGWFGSDITAVAPTSAAFAAVGAIVTNAGLVLSDVNVDSFIWDYVQTSTTPAQLFTAVQAGTGTSGATEPDWTNGGTNTGNVTDGTVTWSRGNVTIITWVAAPLCQSGGSEPTWPTTPGQVVSDGNMAWKCITPIVSDTNCPQSKYVVIASSKVYSGDTDIIRFSATTNPTDWTSEDDAGFLGTGLQSYGSNPTTAIGLYRSNVVPFNSEGCQMWQVDEDPANMALLDTLPIGSVWHKALAPVNDDLFFLSAQGVRTMAISGGSGNLQAGDVGMPIDPIIQAGIAFCKANNVEPIGQYYPGAGQYWLVFPSWVPSAYFPAIAASGPYTTGDTVFVYTMTRKGEVGAWNRYVFPFAIAGFVMLNDELCIRTTSDDVLFVDPTATQDFQGDTYLGASRATYFPGAVQWHYLDFGQPGTTKQFDTMDLACAVNGNVTVQIGYDQSDTTALTLPFVIPADSVPGMQIPIPIMAPSISIRLTFSSADNWLIESLNVNVQDNPPTV